MERNDSFKRRNHNIFCKSFEERIFKFDCPLGEAESVHDQMQITGRSLMCRVSVCYSKHLNSPHYLVQVLSESD